MHVYRYEGLVFYPGDLCEIPHGYLYEAVQEVQEPLIGPPHYRPVAFRQRHRDFGVARPQNLQRQQANLRRCDDLGFTDQAATFSFLPRARLVLAEWIRLSMPERRIRV